MSDRTKDTVSPEPATARLDVPSAMVPNVDRPWDANPVDRSHRLHRRDGDRSAHRLHHGLFEDLLN
jgi:hypothetical protein